MQKLDSIKRRRHREIDEFFAELKRRHVYRAAVAYAAIGWLVIQVATQVLPFLEVSAWVVRTSLLWL
jgi:hypothetical protein